MTALRGGHSHSGPFASRSGSDEQSLRPMPPQPPTTFRIEDLKARLKLEPKSRLFYPLAEGLRKIQRFADAEKVLRDGLTVHAGYISAWISLGRVLYELGKYREAVEILQKACTLDPGNVVAAR